jgi:hypothetical protein
MSSDGPSGFGRFLTILLLLLAVGGFGMAALCGGVFTVASISGGEMSGLWMIALPSLLIGGWLCWLCARTLIRTLRRPPAPPLVGPGGDDR